MWERLLTLKEIYAQAGASPIFAMPPSTWHDLSEECRKEIALMREVPDLVLLAQDERFHASTFIMLSQMGMVSVGAFKDGKQPITLHKDVIQGWLDRYMPPQRFAIGDSVTITGLYPSIGRDGVHTRGKWFALTNDQYVLSLYGEDWSLLERKGHTLPRWNDSRYSKAKPFHVCIEAFVSLEIQPSGWRIAALELPAEAKTSRFA